jgi:hypothetical protein
MIENNVCVGLASDYGMALIEEHGVLLSAIEDTLGMAEIMKAHHPELCWGAPHNGYIWHPDGSGPEWCEEFKYNQCSYKYPSITTMITTEPIVFYSRCRSDWIIISQELDDDMPF